MPERDPRESPEKSGEQEILAVEEVVLPDGEGLLLTASWGTEGACFEMIEGEAEDASRDS
jgi:hypothetical protein